MGRDARDREKTRQIRARTPDKVAVRAEQLREAERVVKLAWDSGYFDNVDRVVEYPFEGRLNATYGWKVLQARVVKAVEQLLQGQYPEVHGYAVSDTTSWTPGRPRFRIRVELRPWLRDGRLRPKREVH